MATTRWTDNVLQEIDDSINKMLSYNSSGSNDNDKIEYINWNLTKQLDENEKLNFNNRDIEFNYISFSYDKVTPGDQPLEDRITNHKGFIIVYSNGVNINYIINQKSSALLILRKLLGYNGRSEITSNCFLIESDLFIWLISKVYDLENVLGGEDSEEEYENIIIDAIKGFKGDTDDLLTKVTADGESVMNIISTLSFLLESRNLKQIRLDMKYKNHNNVELTLDSKGTITTSTSGYVGEFEECGNRYSSISKIYLLIYLEIVPRIMQLFRDEKENDIWNEQANVNFLKKVASDLTEKVDSKINSLISSVT
ncbi:hypothetical protein ACPWSR_13110 [Alloiococcus sp. CFN-8]|uniref:hypothetical protein n=1 Tax=Alloiococcus sp. CFN-8 TaxID=3416081 RepID=UPI003CEF07B6